MSPSFDDADYHACARATLSFFHALDTRRYEDVAALMARDGVWLRQGVELAGPAAVLRLCARGRPRVPPAMSSLICASNLARPRLAANLCVHRCIST